MCEMKFSDLKCNKDYYHCSFRPREVQNSHELESKVRSQGLAIHTQEILHNIIKYDLHAKPGKPRERF